MFDARFDNVSNREDWIVAFDLLDAQTDEVIADLDGVTIEIALRRKGECTPRATASTSAGSVVELGGGVLQWTFPRSTMAGLCPDTYEIGVTMERDDITSQMIIGILPIVDGIILP